MEKPLYYWDPVIAPSDMVVYKGETFTEWEGDLLIAALVGKGIVRLEMEGPMVVAEERLLREFGRIRDVEITYAGDLLLITDYKDGRLVRVSLPAD
jgi:aldose sugar dehydrogenase